MVAALMVVRRVWATVIWLEITSGRLRSFLGFNLRRRGLERGARHIGSGGSANGGGGGVGRSWSYSDEGGTA